MRKKGFEFSFAWLFGLIVGAVVLFLAIYAVTRLIGAKDYQIDTVTAKQMSIVFEPLETGLASGKKIRTVNLNEDTRIYNDCFDSDVFGYQEISIATKSGFLGDWSKPGGETKINNKYIFSDNVEEGDKFYFFSKSFEMPFKISEIIFMSSKKYCFQNPPENIKDEILGLGVENININNCSEEDIEVCFGSGECDIKVTGNCRTDCESEYDYGYVLKGDEKVFYYKSLIYGGIFSSSDVYECNVQRLIKRLKQETSLYNEETMFLSGICGNSLSLGLLELETAIGKVSNSEDLLSVIIKSKELEEKHDSAECQLW